MKKILVRSGMSPLDTFSVDEIIRKNTIGNNSGNLIYAYSVFRNMTTKDIELISDYYRKNPDDADFINENYDAYILPLANGIRKGFIPSLKKYTALIERLKIPVYVVGLGMQFPYEPNIRQSRPFDEDVKNFVKAVLKKSSILGLRGQITSDYLSYLGFKEGRDHQVIGCPSMYTFGNNIKIKELNLNNTSSICVNMTPKADKEILKFLNKLPHMYNNLNFIPQDIDELVLCYSGFPLPGRSVNTKLNNYPNNPESYLYKNGKVKYFLNAPTWINFMKSIDLSIGTRVHGNIAPTLSGTPSITIPIDARMRELVEYHNLPFVSIQDINKNTHLEDLVEKVDFRSVEKKHKKNYDNFIDFLDKNGVEHLYDKNSENAQQPLEEKLESIHLKQFVNPITGCDYNEVMNRLEKGFSIMLSKSEKTNNTFNKQLKNRNKDIAKLKKDNKKLTNKIENLKKDNKKLTNKIENLNKTIINLKDSNKKNTNKLEAKINKIENSLSWKITKPFRRSTKK